MKEVKFTLIADGSSDATLLKIIKWSLDDLFPNFIHTGTFADFRFLPNPPKLLKGKVEYAKKYFPSDILFIHRDAESIDIKSIDTRVIEIQKALTEKEQLKSVFVIPVKMMETWLLIDAEAIKKAAGNRKYNFQIQLPPIAKLEKEKQPKELLHDLLRKVSGLKSRNLEKFNVNHAVHLVAENIQNFEPLRNLTAFNAFEDDLKNKAKHIFQI